jgi:hypothetical protein
MAAEANPGLRDGHVADRHVAHRMIIGVDDLQPPNRPTMSRSVRGCANDTLVDTSPMSLSFIATRYP